MGPGCPNHTQPKPHSTQTEHKQTSEGAARAAGMWVRGYAAIRPLGQWQKQAPAPAPAIARAPDALIELACSKLLYCVALPIPRMPIRPYMHRHRHF